MRPLVLSAALKQPILQLDRGEDWRTQFSTVLLGDAVVLLYVRYMLTAHAAGFLLADGPETTLGLPASLIDAAYRELVENAYLALQSEVSGAPAVNPILQTDELLRRAGQRLMAWVAGIGIPVEAEDGLGYGPADGARLYQAMTNIAMLSYEGGGASGTVLFCDPNWADGGGPIYEDGEEIVADVVEFLTPIPIWEEQRVRTLVETSTEDLRLLADVFGVRGLGRIKRTDVAHSLFEVVFTKGAQWELRRGKKPVMSVSHGYPSLPVERFPRASFDEGMDRVFGDLGGQTGLPAGYPGGRHGPEARDHRSHLYPRPEGGWEAYA
ncbi:MAG: hypothetical protein GX936_10725 [Clostridiales bacterium]|nr:hypothetical protein [Clostridiales bacterium]